MKQFISCIIGSFLVYLLLSLVSGTPNPYYFGAGTKLVFGFLVFIIWVVPIIVNFFDGEENFKN